MSHNFGIIKIKNSYTVGVNRHEREEKLNKPKVIPKTDPQRQILKIADKLKEKISKSNQGAATINKKPTIQKSKIDNQNVGKGSLTTKHIRSKISIGFGHTSKEANNSNFKMKHSKISTPLAKNHFLRNSMTKTHSTTEFEIVSSLSHKQSIDGKSSVFDYKGNSTDREYKSIKAKLNMSMQLIVNDESDELFDEMNTEDEPNSAGFDKYNSKLLSNRPIMSSHKKNKYLSKIEEMDEENNTNQTSPSKQIPLTMRMKKPMTGGLLKESQQDCWSLTARKVFRGENFERKNHSHLYNYSVEMDQIEENPFEMIENDERNQQKFGTHRSSTQPLECSITKLKSDRMKKEYGNLQNSSKGMKILSLTQARENKRAINQKLRQSKVDRLDDDNCLNECDGFSTTSEFAIKSKISISNLQDTRNKYKIMKIDNSPGKEYGNTMKNVHESTSKVLSRHFDQEHNKIKRNTFILNKY